MAFLNRRRGRVNPPPADSVGSQLHRTPQGSFDTGTIDFDPETNRAFFTPFPGAQRVVIPSTDPRHPNFQTNTQTVTPGPDTRPTIEPGAIVVTSNPGTSDAETTVRRADGGSAPIVVADPFAPSRPGGPTHGGRGSRPGGSGAINSGGPAISSSEFDVALPTATSEPAQDHSFARPDDALPHQRAPGPNAVFSDRTAVPRPVEGLMGSLAAAQARALDASARQRNQLRGGGRASTIGGGFGFGNGISSRPVARGANREGIAARFGGRGSAPPSTPHVTPEGFQRGDAPQTGVATPRGEGATASPGGFSAPPSTATPTTRRRRLRR